MSDLTPGDILLTRATGVVPALIRFGERVRYQGWWRAVGHLLQKAVGVAQPDGPGDPWYVSHAAVFVGDGQLIEALAHGLTLTPLSRYTGHETVTVPLAALVPDVTGADRTRAVRFAHTQLERHDRYGWLSIASIILQLVTPARLDVSWDGALICSAFAAQCLEHAGVTLPTRSSLTTMPADLAAMIPHLPATSLKGHQS